MSIFGTQARQGGEEESQAAWEIPQENFEDVPSFPKPRANTVIAKGVTLTGALQGQGVVEVEGTVDGELNLDGSVIITPTGLVTGPVAADVIRVAGRVVGCVTAREHLRLEKTGSIEGDVSTTSLVVEDGGRLNGRAAMLKPAAESMPSANVPPVEELQFGPNSPVGDKAESTANV
jgi:cytoskeletal protein CcmA (bactofilin family)